MGSSRFREVQGMKRFRQLKPRDRGFEAHSRYACLCAPTAYRITKQKEADGAQKIGARAL
jgi:hypothetical protein